ncbi:hypothetical protein PoB_007155400 [Plakobranchus ocellatus]|uniref:Uncharacterized protein n=1 Tax=Plakobranchus ocellatus TaxID=259542 RepID=A0AAV4DLF9_9GAST|nr:hypothetical protein PoB_007155400 [Plakobranchus ocellatus]
MALLLTACNLSTVSASAIIAVFRWLIYYPAVTPWSVCRWVRTISSAWRDILVTAEKTPGCYCYLAQPSCCLSELAATTLYILTEEITFGGALVNSVEVMTAFIRTMDTGQYGLYPWYV